MLKHISKIDSFSKNVLLVFCGTTLVNVFNLLFQLLIAHKLNPQDFASFNALLSVFVIIASPLSTIQTILAKFISEFKAKNELNKVYSLVTSLFKKFSVFSLITLLIFLVLSFVIVKGLKIDSLYAGLILASLLALSWFSPLFSGILQGIESFKWLTLASFIGGLLKLLLAAVFIFLGFNVTGALSAFFISSLFIMLISVLPLKALFVKKVQIETILYKEMFLYIFPVALSTFCFMTLVSSDLILVKLFFSPGESGVYSVAQMVGKIFLFLPAAITLVMFPKTSGQNAAKKDSLITLKKSLFFAFILCLGAVIFYNLFPSFVLKVLTGKSTNEAVLLGRFFSLAMSQFTLLYVIIMYLLSIKRLEFLRILIFFTILQIVAIILLHTTLLTVASLLCLNSAILLLLHLKIVFSAKNKI